MASRSAQLPIALLRIVIGWHFLYEGWTKIIFPGWSSSGYLIFSAGPFAGLFRWIASDETVLRIVDQLNIWGLTAIGLALLLGVFIRPAAVSGISLLALYYLSNPPLFKAATGVSEGQYLIVNKNVVELLALAVVFAFPSASLGLGTLVARYRRRAGQQPAVPDAQKPLPAAPASRRELLASLAGLPFLGVFVMAVLKKHGWKSFEEMHLQARKHPNDVKVASATLRSFRFSTIRDLKGTLPTAKVGNVTLSRMILGGNLIGGWAHARDLIYVSNLVKAYHTRNKVFETFDLAEACGVNTILTNPQLAGIINQYWRSGGKIQFISDLGGADVFGLIRKSVDQGACACYVQGAISDRWVAEGKFDDMAKALDLVRKSGVPAGIGAHKLETVKGCVEKGLRPDFWVKTLHQSNYWSARPQEPENDNNWCANPEDTVAFMKNLPEPWIAFKILAAGAIEPKVGFKYAFKSGADVICVGMYDFQIVDDVNIALDVLNSRLARNRQWRA